MTTPQRFWKILGETGGGDDGRFEALKERLKRLKPEEIMAFYRRYEQLISAANKIDLWGAASLINDGASDDGFYYFRAWLVSMGKKVYEKALANPDSLASVLDEDDETFCESDLYAAAPRAWEEKTGRSDEAFYEELSRGDNSELVEGAEEGEDWDFEDEEEMRRRLPKLSRKFLDAD